MSGRNGQQHLSGGQILHGLRAAKEQEAQLAQMNAQHMAKLEMFAQQDKMTICGMASRLMAAGGSINDAVTKAFDLFEGVEAEWARRGEQARAEAAGATPQE